MLKKKKQKSLSYYKRKLWKVFSEYIRRRDADEHGMVQCISCKGVTHWKLSQAGHFIPKSLGLSIYFEEKNVHNQCVYCNLNGGNPSGYAIALKERYGNDIVEQLHQQKNMQIQISRQGYEEMIERYQEKLRMVTQ